MAVLRRHGTRDGFTLVELLVAVGIIVVLIAMLFPALVRAREHARRTKCAANLLAIGQALSMYTQRYGHYPSGMVTVTNGGAMHYGLWPVRIREFTSGNQDVFYCPSQDERCRWEKQFGGPGEIAGPVHEHYGYEPDERLLIAASTVATGTGTYFSYGYNAFGSIGSGSPWAKGLGHYLMAQSPAALARWHEPNVSRVKAPAEMVAVTDTTADGWIDVASSPTNLRLWPSNLHGGGANVLFCDGHVQWYPQTEVTCAPGATDSRSKAVQRMWNIDNRPDSAP